MNTTYAPPAADIDVPRSRALIVGGIGLVGCAIGFFVNAEQFYRSWLIAYLLFLGITLGSITHTLEALPGLLVLVPAAIGMRGNVFGALGSRLGTQIHAGTFRLSRRVDTEVGQNIGAAILLSLSISAVLAVFAKVMCGAFSIGHTISIADFISRDGRK